MSFKELVLRRKIIEKLSQYITNKRRQKNRLKLKNHDFSIFCSNCTGGIISHELGERFNSPTVNLRISSKEFVKFMLNIHEYLEQELIFFDGEENCPMAHLGDITIVFAHYKDVDSALEKWNERKKRVNWDNIYVILNDRDGMTYEDLKALSNVPCKNMVVFTAKEYPEFPYTFCLHQFCDQNEVGYTLDHLPITNEWYFERFFDYTAWLNSEREACENFRKRR